MTPLVLSSHENCSDMGRMATLMAARSMEQTKETAVASRMRVRASRDSGASSSAAGEAARLPARCNRSCSCWRGMDTTERARERSVGLGNVTVRALLLRWG
jgi:hypothetical protein